MSSSPENLGPSLASLEQRLTRTLRHEMGDFLQKLYATVAILQYRLPADMPEERDLLARLRARAEGCRALFDTVQDFVGPIGLACSPVDLSQVAAELVTAARPRYPALQIEATASEPALVSADPERARQVGSIILANACEAANSQVVFHTRTNPTKDGVEWTVTDDGAGLSPALPGLLFEPFCTTRPGHAGLGLAFAQKLLRLHGGTISVRDNAPVGFSVTACFPGMAKSEPVDGAADRH
jgi:signal transduction histidine kinase